MALSRLDNSSLNPPDEPTHNQTAQVARKLPHTTQIQGVTIYHTGEPTTTRWYADGSKRWLQNGKGIPAQIMHMNRSQTCNIGIMFQNHHHRMGLA